MDVAFFFNSSSDFNNHYFILFFFLPFLAMPLPQLLNFFLFPYFGNGIATIRFSQFFFSPYFGNAIATITLPQIFFSPYFGYGITTISLSQIFFFYFSNAIATNPFHFFLRNDTCTQFLQQILSARLLLLD